MPPRLPAGLIQVDCGDSCSPHAFCRACRTLTCRHTWQLLVETEDVRAAIAALPTRPRRHVAYVPRPGFRRLDTCPLRRLPVAMTIAQVGAWTVIARHDHLGVC